jgi:hypothetical protein
MVFVHSRKDTAKTAQKLVNPTSHLNINFGCVVCLEVLVCKLRLKGLYHQNLSACCLSNL